MRSRKIGVFFLVGMLIALAYGSAWAIILPAPTFGAKFADVTFSDFDYNGVLATAGYGLPLHPLQTDGNETGNVWGIFALTSVHTLTDNNPENNNLGIPAVYNPGSDGKYYYGVYGGLTYDRIVNNEIFLDADPNSSLGAYLRVYEVSAADAGVYTTAVNAGPGPVSAAGAGHFGNFGSAIINASSASLWLDAQFSPGTLQNYTLQAHATDLEKVGLSSSTTGKAEAYLDVIGGTAASSLDTDILPLSMLFPGTDADLKMISDLTTNYNASGWTNGSWTTNSQDPITGGVVPEPGTMLLLGSGLVGLASFGRAKAKRTKA